MHVFERESELIVNFKHASEGSHLLILVLSKNSFGVKNYISNDSQVPQDICLYFLYWYPSRFGETRSDLKLPVGENEYEYGASLLLLVETTFGVIRQIIGGSYDSVMDNFRLSGIFIRDVRDFWYVVASACYLD